MEKSLKTESLLCFFLGFAGAHKFYRGKVGQGILYLLTLGIFGFGWIFDTFRLAIRRIKEEPASSRTRDVPQPVNVPLDETSLYTYIAGVKYDNDDGTSRQKAVKELEIDDEVNLVASYWSGSPAIEVYSETGQMLGYIPNKDKGDIYSLVRNGKIQTATVIEFYDNNGIRYVDLEIGGY